MGLQAWILGDSFMKNVYSIVGLFHLSVVFRARLKTIGFALFAFAVRSRVNICPFRDTSLVAPQADEFPCSNNRVGFANITG